MIYTDAENVALAMVIEETASFHEVVSFMVPAVKVAHDASGNHMALTVHKEKAGKAQTGLRRTLAAYHRNRTPQRGRSDVEVLKSKAVNFYTQLFTSMGSEIEDYAVQGDFWPLPNVTVADLKRPVTVEEIEHVFRSMDCRAL
ncbi:hypothetical protein V6N11_001210 [Hibiscus sabdariffa]|uniref:Uncharacterized protein n=1 Tax=Hibiscus sabdariffa TaxID=183260 RepID=A0ABR2RZM6_9ROSI